MKNRRPARKDNPGAIRGFFFPGTWGSDSTIRAADGRNPTRGERPYPCQNITLRPALGVLAAISLTIWQNSSFGTTFVRFGSSAGDPDPSDGPVRKDEQNDN
jgi:hypothetical protein